jgi:hypothetical protein
MEDDVGKRLATAQLRRAELENQKLTLELARLGTPTPWTQKLFQFVPMVTAIVSVAGFLWGVKLYVDTQAKEARNRSAQAEHENTNAEREFMKPWLESQRQIYGEALDAATTALLAADPKDRAKAVDGFWKLYHGRMVLVETHSVSGVMKQIKACLENQAACQAEYARARLLALGSAMAQSMADTAKKSYTQFAANQFRY